MVPPRQGEPTHTHTLIKLNHDSVRAILINITAPPLDPLELAQSFCLLWLVCLQWEKGRSVSHGLKSLRPSSNRSHSGKQKVQPIIDWWCSWPTVHPYSGQHIWDNISLRGPLCVHHANMFPNVDVLAVYWCHLISTVAPFIIAVAFTGYLSHENQYRQFSTLALFSWSLSVNCIDHKHWEPKDNQWEPEW